MQPTPEPVGSRWVEEALTTLREDLALYVATFGRILRGPAAFARAWHAREIRASNPLVFMSTSAAVLGALDFGVGRWFGLSEDETLLGSVVDAFGPYVYYAAVALICHALLFGWRRGRIWSDPIAVALYVGGSAGALVGVASVGFVVAVSLTSQDLDVGGADVSYSGLLTLIPLLLFAGFLGVLARALAGLYQASWWLTVGVLAVPVALTSLTATWVTYPVPCLVLGVERDEHGYHVEIGVDT